jgi:hypothetical protein
VRNEFLAEHPEAVAEFIEQQAPPLTLPMLTLRASLRWW